MSIVNCQICGRRLYRSNGSGRCIKCQRARKALAVCAAGCGRHLDVRNTHLLCKPCSLRLAYAITSTLAAMAKQEGAERELLTAAVAFTAKPYLTTRADDLTAALLALGAAKTPPPANEPQHKE